MSAGAHLRKRAQAGAQKCIMCWRSTRVRLCVTLLHSHAVDTILLLARLVRSGLMPVVDGVVEDKLRTSAALAAAAFGPSESSAACGFFPSVLPPCGALIFVGAAARAFSGLEGAFAGCAPSVLPSPLNCSLSLPQQLPMAS